MNLVFDGANADGSSPFQFTIDGTGNVRGEGALETPRARRVCSAIMAEQANHGFIRFYANVDWERTHAYRTIADGMARDYRKVND